MKIILPNPLPRSWVGVLRVLAEYSYLVRPQMSALLYPNHKSSRYVRKILSAMIHAKLIGKTRRKITFDALRSGCPVYYLTEKGVEALAQATENTAYLAASCKIPRSDRLEHWISSSQTHIVLDTAVSRQSFVNVPLFIHEWNRYRADGHDQYYLHVQFQENPTPKSCSPDAAFLMVVEGLMQPVYIENDLNTSSPAQVVHRKAPGYDLLWQSGKFRTQHFPQLEDHNDFIILVVTTDRWRRDRLARIAKDVRGGHRWRFTAVIDVTPETILHERIMVDTDLDLKRLCAPPAEYAPLGIDVSLPVPKAGVVLDTANNQKKVPAEGTDLVHP